MLELLSPALEVGSRLRMTFDARWKMEVDDTDPTISYDGAVMELSADDGGSWTDVGSDAKVGTGTSTAARSSTRAATCSAAARPSCPTTPAGRTPIA